VDAPKPDTTPQRAECLKLVHSEMLGLGVEPELCSPPFSRPEGSYAPEDFGFSAHVAYRASSSFAQKRYSPKFCRRRERVPVNPTGELDRSWRPQVGVKPHG
jgi:hypothetical protein